MPVELKVPSVGESITEVQIGAWRKSVGEAVAVDEEIVELESDKATFDAPAPVAGVITKILKKSGEIAQVGEVIAYIDESATASTTGESTKQPPAKADKKKEGGGGKGQASHDESRIMPAAQRLLEENGLKADEVTASGPGGRLLKEDVLKHLERMKQAQPSKSSAPSELRRIERDEKSPSVDAGRQTETVPMTSIRRRIAERLVSAQKNAALLTTFNEVDMTAVNELRRLHKDAFLAKHGVKLGFMSFFVKASIDALKQFPQLNAQIRGTDIVFHNYYDIGVAIGTEKGLVVPVLRNAERMSFAEIESTIEGMGRRARDGKLSIEELQGGTFTISNGGIYGSLLSTPIVNPPQSGVLGMHAIQERPVARNGQVVIRPMMYLALSYDHRIVDGREAVTFLRRIKESLEEPARMLLEV